MLRIEKIQKDLARVQKGARVRLLTLEDVVDIVDEAANTIKELPKWIRNGVTYYFVVGVANSYRGYAESTAMWCNFTKDGKPKSVSFARINSPKISYGAYKEEFIIDRKVLKKYFDLEYMSPQLERYLYSSLGFDKNGIKRIIGG